jgi:hypothetical protein
MIRLPEKNPDCRNMEIISTKQGQLSMFFLQMATISPGASV